MQTNTNNIPTCSQSNINIAFIEELIALESMRDNINYIGEILKSYIAGDYGFSVKIIVNGKNIQDEIYQKSLKDYQYIKDKKIRQNIKKYAEAKK